MEEATETYAAILDYPPPYWIIPPKSFSLKLRFRNNYNILNRNDDILNIL